MAEASNVDRSRMGTSRARHHLMKQRSCQSPNPSSYPVFPHAVSQLTVHTYGSSFTLCTAGHTSRHRQPPNAPRKPQIAIRDPQTVIRKPDAGRGLRFEVSG
jgi:hypothetical protein